MLGLSAASRIVRRQIANCKGVVHLIIAPRNKQSAQTAPFSSTSMVNISNKLALGAGCYWGTEKYVVKDFQKQYPGSISKAAVGFMAPDPNNKIVNPSYRDVCSGRTGHVEVLYVELKEPVEEKTFEELMKFFYMFHDPTTKDRQGNDAGTQYSSVVLCDGDKQKEIATRVKEELQKLVTDGVVTGFANKKIETQITDLNTFYPAHDEHQQYLEKNPNGYCNHYFRFKVWPTN